MQVETTSNSLIKPVNIKFIGENSPIKDVSPWLKWVIKLTTRLTCCLGSGIKTNDLFLQGDIEFPRVRGFHQHTFLADLPQKIVSLEVANRRLQ